MRGLGTSGQWGTGGSCSPGAVLRAVIPAISLELGPGRKSQFGSVSICVALMPGTPSTAWDVFGMWGGGEDGTGSPGSLGSVRVSLGLNPELGHSTRPQSPLSSGRGGGEEGLCCLCSCQHTQQCHCRVRCFQRGAGKCCSLFMVLFLTSERSARTQSSFCALSETKPGTQGQRSCIPRSDRPWRHQE